MCFRKKTRVLQTFIPDIAVIAECENSEVMQKKNISLEYTDFIWFGKNINKGLGIMSFNGYKIELLEHNKEFEYILPIRAFKGSREVFILAVWTQFVRTTYESYVVQAVRAFNFYNTFLKEKNPIIVGDFNSSVIWDDGDAKESTHSDMLMMLNQKNIISLYHHKNNEEQGKERLPTFYLHKKEEKSYHIDYCFLNKQKIKSIKNFSVGEYSDFIQLSDHMPMFFEIE